jgi:acyl-CoA synthetase (AMP-forming)/AMP-acid ligase II
MWRYRPCLRRQRPRFALAVAGTLSSRPLAPINPRLTARELAAVVGRLPSPIIVAEPASAEIAQAVASRTGRRVAVVPDLQLARKALDFDRPEDAVAVVLHTSGTTGLPKAVEVTHHKLTVRTQRQGAVMGLVRARPMRPSRPCPTSLASVLSSLPSDGGNRRSGSAIWHGGVARYQALRAHPRPIGSGHD